MIARLLRKKGASNIAARDGKTPLHLAARDGKLEIVRMLVKAGASLNQKDKAGSTPVQPAARADYLDVVKILTGQGCSVPDAIVASVLGRVELLESFLRSDPKALQEKTRAGQTLLHLAVWSGNAELVTILAAKGLAVDARNAVAPGCFERLRGGRHGLNPGQGRCSIGGG